MKQLFKLGRTGSLGPSGLGLREKTVTVRMMFMVNWLTCLHLGTVCAGTY